MKWENTLIAYEEDIKSRSFWDWTSTYIILSFCEFSPQVWI